MKTKTLIAEGCVRERTGKPSRRARLIKPVAVRRARTGTTLEKASASPPADRPAGNKAANSTKHALRSGRRVAEKARALSGDDAAQVPTSDLRFEWVGIDQVSSYHRALSDKSDRPDRHLMSSVKEFGLVSPLVVTTGGEVIVGERRLAAARALGLNRVPVVRAEHLTPLQVRQYRIADNRLAEHRKWNAGALRAELQEIIVLEPEVNIEAMGFEVAEFDVALQDDGAQADEDDIIPPTPSQPLSREGDVWEIDGHTITCANSTVKEQVASACTDRAQVVFADPPFNVPYAGHMGGKGAIRHPEFIEGYGEKSEAEFLKFQTSWLKNVGAVLAPGGLLYVATDWRAMFVTQSAAQACGHELINLCVWQKTVPGLGSMYRSGHELFLVLRKPGAASRNNVRLGAYGRFRSNCWSYPGATSFGTGRKDLALHPTAKPVALIADILLDCTKRGDLVFDPFSGSGATLIAAQRTGRKARVIDLDPRYVDVAVRRYEAVYGRAPRLRGSGLTLAELASAPPRSAPLRGTSQNGAENAARPRRKRARASSTARVVARPQKDRRKP